MGLGFNLLPTSRAIPYNSPKIDWLLPPTCRTHSVISYVLDFDSCQNAPKSTNLNIILKKILHETLINLTHYKPLPRRQAQPDYKATPQTLSWIKGKAKMDKKKEHGRRDEN